jgi:aromatic amino acid aminotransferase I
MFLWVRLKIENHPDFPSKTPEDISNQVFHSLVKEKVLVAPSVYFKAPSTTMFNSEEEARNIFVRLSFSLPPPEQMEEGAKRMGRALAAEWGA